MCNREHRSIVSRASVSFLDSRQCLVPVHVKKTSIVDTGTVCLTASFCCIHCGLRCTVVLGTKFKLIQCHAPANILGCLYRNCKQAIDSEGMLHCLEAAALNAEVCLYCHMYDAARDKEHCPLCDATKHQEVLCFCYNQPAWTHSSWHSWVAGGHIFLKYLSASLPSSSSRDVMHAKLSFV